VSTGSIATDVPSHSLPPRAARWAARSGPGHLDRVRQVGLGVLAFQLVGLLSWSNLLADRFALTWDFSIYHQAWWLIDHGQLDPYGTLNGFAFWANHGEFLFWPLALLGLAWPHAATLLWVQDLAIVGAEAVAFLWLCDVADSRTAPRTTRSLRPEVLAAVGLVVLVADPWIYWAASFDFHFEMIGILFVLLAARELYRDPSRRRVWLWVCLGLACGDVVATYLVGVGLSAVLVGHRWRRTGLAVVAVSLGWVILLTLLGANKGSGLFSSYGYLAVGAGTAAPPQLDLVQLVTGTLRHPQHVASVLWSRRLDLYGSIATGGFIGVLCPWVIVPTVLVHSENALTRSTVFIVPGVQDALLYMLIPVGTIWVLASLGRWYPRWAFFCALVVALNALAWGAVWLPRTAPQWLRVSPAAATVLASVQRQIPTTDEIVASQGVAGQFSGRRWFYTVVGAGTVPVHTATVWVIVAASQGIETASDETSSALVAELAGPLRARLVASRAGVWAFRWVPRPGTHELRVPATATTLPAWTAVGPAGRVTTQGPAADWRAVANTGSGYVISGDYWREPRGRYEATALLSATVPVNVEVWNATGDVLLARRSVPPTNGPITVSLPVDALQVYPDNVYGGFALFRILPVPPTPGDALEIRVWTPGGGAVSVSSLHLAPLRGTAAS